MSKYIIVEAKFVNSLQSEVNKKMAEGYFPVGGVCESSALVGKSLIQAMVKRPFVTDKRHDN